MMHRAYAAIEVKSVSEEKRIISGLATSPVPDRAGDIVDPMGAKFAKTIPLFLYHDSTKTVGTATLGKPTKNGIPFEAHLPKIAEHGSLKDRVDEAWQMVKYKLIAAVSIGFNPVREAIENTKEGGYHFKESEILELSLVPIPMQSLATIDSIKSFDASTRTALGIKEAATKAASGGSGAQSPGASGHLNSTTRKSEMNLQELRTALAEKTARMREIQEAASAEKRSFTDEERTEIDTLGDECDSLNDEIRVQRVKSITAVGATPVNTVKELGARGPQIIVKREDPEDKFPGQSYVRVLLAKACSRLLDESPIAVAQKRWGKSHPKLVEFIKASVAGGGTGSGEWGSELAQSDTRFNGDFLTFLYGRTVFDRLPLRSIPARVHVKGQDGASTGYWVGESKPIPASAQDYSSVELTPLKVAALAVISNELMMDSDPAAEMLVRDALVEASSQRVDTTFLGSAAAVSGVSPAGLLNGLDSLGNAGSDADAVRADIMALYAPFITAKNASGLAFVMTPSMAKSISLMRNAFGQREFEGLNASGGTLEGDPVYTGDNVGAGDLILLKPSDIWKIGDSGVQVTMSNVATIEQADDPTGATDTPVAQTNYPVSMFQSESTAFKVVRRINYAKRRTGVVQYIGDAYYGSQASS